MVHEAKKHVQKHPSEAADIGNIERGTVNILQRALNKMIGKNQEISGALAAYCLIGMNSIMHSRKFWYTFIEPAVSFQLKLKKQRESTNANDNESNNESNDADIVQDSSNDVHEGYSTNDDTCLEDYWVDESYLNDFNDDDYIYDADDEQYDGQSADTWYDNIYDVADDYDEFAEPCYNEICNDEGDFYDGSDEPWFDECFSGAHGDDSNDCSGRGCDDDVDMPAPEEVEHPDSAFVSEHRDFVAEREEDVLDQSEAALNPLHDDDEVGNAEIFRSNRGGQPIMVEQHQHYEHRGPGLRHINLDEYSNLICIAPKEERRHENDECVVDCTETSAAVEESDEDSSDSDDEESDSASQKIRANATRRSDKNGTNISEASAADAGSDEESSAAGADDSRSAAHVPRGSGKNGARTRNGRFDFDDKHPLCKSHEQRLRSDVRIGILAGRGPPPFPGPQSDTAVWRRTAQTFAQYIVTLLCPWNPATSQPERFDRVKNEWIPVPLTWDGMCEWVQDLYDREQKLQRDADQRSSDDCLAEVEDNEPWLSARLFRFRNLVTNLRTTVGARNANAWFRHRASTKWNDTNRKLVDQCEAYAPREADAEWDQHVDETIKDLLIDADTYEDGSKAAQEMQENQRLQERVEQLFTEDNANGVKLKAIPATSMANETLKFLYTKLKADKVTHVVEASTSNDAAGFNDNAPGVHFQANCIETSDSDTCTKEQENVLTLVTTWLQKKKNSEDAGKPPLLLVHGPGGTLAAL